MKARQLCPEQKVVLLDKATGLARTQETQFQLGNTYLCKKKRSFPEMTRSLVTMKSFVQSEAQLSVEVAKSYNINVTLKVGAATERGCGNSRRWS